MTRACSFALLLALALSAGAQDPQQGEVSTLEDIIQQQGAEREGPADGHNIPYIRIAQWTVGSAGFEGERAREISLVTEVVRQFDAVCLHGIRPGETWHEEIPDMASALTGAAWNIRTATAQTSPKVQSALLWRSDRLDNPGDYHRVLPHQDVNVPLIPPQVVRLSFRGAPFWLGISELTAQPLGRGQDGIRHTTDIIAALADSKEAPPVFFCIQSNSLPNDVSFTRLNGIAKAIVPAARGIDRRTEVPPYSGSAIWTNFKRPVRSGVFPLAATLGLTPRDAQGAVAPTSPTFLLTTVAQ